MTEISHSTIGNEPPPEFRGSVLFVDDEENILTSIRRLIRKQNINAFFATSGQEGLLILEREKIDVIISDMRMPNMDGSEFLTHCKKRWPKTVRVLLTGFADINSTVKALNGGGIFRYLSKPWDDNELVETIDQGLRICQLERDKLSLLLLTKNQNQKLQKFNETLELTVAARTSEIQQTADMLELVYEQLKSSYSDFIKLFSSVISSRQNLAKTKCQKVAELSEQIARSLNLPENEVKEIYFAGLLIDIGKLHLSDELLNKPEEELSKEQRYRFEKHPLHAEMALSTIQELEPTGKIIRTYMENLNGSGFPDKLMGSSITRGARILRVARDFVGLQSGLIRDICLSTTNAYSALKMDIGKKYDGDAVKALEPLTKNFDLGELLAHEIRLTVRQLMPGLVVSRDVLNNGGIIMIAKNYKLTECVIQKLISLCVMHDDEKNIYIYKQESAPK